VFKSEKLEKVAFYSPVRVYLVFRFLLSLFLIIKKRDKFLFISPLSPIKLKETIYKLGTSFVKLSQVLATRSDFFDDSYIEQLKELHDQLPPMEQKSYQKVFKSSFPENIFEYFDDKPIASASIGQVHKAVYLGKSVAVKLRRDGVEDIVKADVKIISIMLAIFKPLFSKSTENSIEAVLSEFSSMILDEVNLSVELENLKEFREVYANSGVTFPTPYEELCSSSAIVMSFEVGYRFDDKTSILKSGIDFHKIISTLIIFYTEQMLIKGIFHADPHPGNLLVNRGGELILLDFGMVKRVPNRARVAIIELIKSANEKDYELYVSANKRLGTLSYEADESETAEFARKMFNIFSNDNLSSESMQKLAFDVLESTKNISFKLPSDAIYILRVSAIIEGLGTTYIENFNGIKDILPTLQNNIPRALAENSKGVLEELSEISMFWKDIKGASKKLNNGEAIFEIHNDQFDYIFQKYIEENRRNRITYSFYLAGIFFILYEPNYQVLAIGLFSIGVMRTLFLR
jgi:ubiquinone biosynthesis protein